MNTKVLRLTVMTILMIGLSVFGGPSVGHAAPITITDILVTVGSTTFSEVGGTGTMKVWSLPVTLADGQSLLLSQTAGISGATAGYNFDTTDFCLSPGCANPTVRLTTSAGTFTFTDSTNVLGFQGKDKNIAPVPNESQEYVLATGGGGGLLLSLGYADDSHLVGQTCPDAGANCRPDPFTATGGVQANAIAGQCADAVSPCFDAGVLRIVNSSKVPEPSALLLIGAGFLGLAAWGRRRANRKQ